MKIAISTSNQDLDAPFDPRFGRAAFFCIVDTETEETITYPNPAISATGGAGVQAAQFIAEQGIGAVISGSFGPNAFTTLEAANIQAFLAPAEDALTGRDLLARYQSGQLQKATAPSHDGHHGSPRRGRGR